jgi:hypothetical protein
MRVSKFEVYFATVGVGKSASCTVASQSYRSLLSIGIAAIGAVFYPNNHLYSTRNCHWSSARQESRRFESDCWRRSMPYGFPNLLESSSCFGVTLLVIVFHNPLPCHYVPSFLRNMACAC